MKRLEATHFIEVYWHTIGGLSETGIVEIQYLDKAIRSSIYNHCKTIALFKIKYK